MRFGGGFKSGSPEQSYKTQLRNLLLVTQAINNNYSRREILDIYNSILGKQAYIRKFVLFSNHSGLKVESSLHAEEAEIEALLGASLSNEIKNPDNIVYRPAGSSNGYNVLIPAHHKDRVLALLLVETVFETADLSTLPEHVTDSLVFLQTLTNIVFVALENKVLYKENLRRERLQKELELASELQAMLFPPPWNNASLQLDIAAFHVPFSEVGGDYYDYFELNEHEIAFCIADVSGKGISAALLMSNFQANVRALFPIYDNLEELARKLAEKVDRAARGERFITAFLARYNTHTRQLSFVNAGHNPPVLRNGKNTELLEDGTTGLGMITPLPFVHKGERVLEKDAVLVCFTDGVSELQNKKEEFFGYEPVKRVLLDNGLHTAEEVNLTLSLEMNRFKSGTGSFHDDAALLTCRFL